jgi:hypothetical protein
VIVARPLIFLATLAVAMLASAIFIGLVQLPD